jgi:hypothetical protein
MTLTRWKLMAGVLGLSMCGLAALAEPACRTVGYTARQSPTPLPQPLVETGAKPPLLPPPVNVAPPTPGPLQLPVPAAVPVPNPAPTSIVELPLPAPVAKVDVMPKVEPAPLPKATSAPLPPPLPSPAPQVLDEKSFVDAAKQSLNLPPLPSLEKKETPKPPLPAADPVPSAPPVVTPPPLPTPAPVGFATLPDPKPLKEPPPPVIVTPDIVPAGAPKPEVKKEIPVSATTPADRKLKVQLNLGSGKPWFEVRDGEELVLKVVADAVEVKAPAENGSAASVLKASGGVSFRTLGGNGTCDELRVIPGTGEVVVTGRVAVTSNWGKAETTASADKVTFRLGSEVAEMRR